MNRDAFEGWSQARLAEVERWVPEEAPAGLGAAMR